MLGVPGAIGGPITLIKGLAQLAQLVTERAEYTAGQLALMVVIKLVALVVAAAAGFRGGRIFPAVFIGAAIGVLAQALVPGIPVPIAVSARVLGMLLAVSRDGWVALFVAVAVTGSIAALPVLCLALFPAWLVVTKAPEMIVRVPARGPEPSPPTDVPPSIAAQTHDEPVRTDEPVRPDQHGQPDEPVRPDQHGQPDGPARPDQPTRSDQPARPDGPARPDEPVRPDEPARPDGPARPDHPGKASSAS